MCIRQVFTHPPLWLLLASSHCPRQTGPAAAAAAAAGPLLAAYCEGDPLAMIAGSASAVGSAVVGAVAEGWAATGADAAENAAAAAAAAGLAAGRAAQQGIAFLSEAASAALPRGATPAADLGQIPLARLSGERHLRRRCHLGPHAQQRFLKTLLLLLLTYSC